MFLSNPLRTPARLPRANTSARRFVPIVERLAGALAVVDRLPPSPEARALRTRLDRYRHVVCGWVTFIPREEQREALPAEIDDVMLLLVQSDSNIARE